MTTVAWRDGILASDSTADDGCQASQFTKLFRLGRYCFGFAGECAAISTFVSQFKAGIPLEKIKVRGDLRALIATPDGCLWWDRGSDAPFPVEDDFAAIGSGAGYALGAMAMGASAREAVKVAIRFDPHSGGRVRWRVCR